MPTSTAENGGGPERSMPAVARACARFEVAIPADVLEAIVEEVTARVLEQLGEQASQSPFMTIPEAASFLRCGGRRPRQRVDDLLSAGRLTRHKDGSRTLVSRQELLDHVATGLPPARRGLRSVRAAT